MKTWLISALCAAVFTMVSAPSFAQDQSGFKKENFSYNEWTKGKFSEVVTVTNPGKFIFLAGIGPEREGDGKIVELLPTASGAPPLRPMIEPSSAMEWMQVADDAV